MKKIFFTPSPSLPLLFLLASFPFQLFAQSKYAGEPFSIGVGARGLGMGSAFHTLAEGPEALYWNPAGLSRTDRRQANCLAFMHSERFGGEVKYNFIGYSHSLEYSNEPLTVGLGLIHLGVGGIPVVTHLEDPGGELGPTNRPVIDRYVSKNDFAIIVGAGRRLGKLAHVGANVKIFHERYLDVSATGFGFDLGVILPVNLYGQKFLASVSARDATTSFLAWSTGKREYIKPWI
ncbi:MAG TPA: hypothetical protein VJ417_10010 [Candidatus Glassbacteria bacterium]|nr:hypothetical protein [Candidatus Glassbacteria bacterium]